MLTVIVLLIALVLVLIMTTMIALEQAYALTNHQKYCESLKDKKTRSIFCPDIFSKKETTTNLYG